MGGIRASKRRSAKRLSLARSLDDLEVGIDSVWLKESIILSPKNQKVSLYEKIWTVPSTKNMHEYFCEHPIVQDPWREDSNHPTPPPPAALFSTFRFRCLELVLAAITVARGRSQSVLCVGQSCGGVYLAWLMSVGARLNIILTFSHINVDEEPCCSHGLCMHVCIHHGRY